MAIFGGLGPFQEDSCGVSLLGFLYSSIRPVRLRSRAFVSILHQPGAVWSPPDSVGVTRARVSQLRK
jgi:hypothetical protein